MKKLFVYYSLSGNGDAVAALMKEKGYDVLKAETAKPMPKGMVGRILVGGFTAGIKQRAKLSTDLSGVNDYDEIVVGSPVWNGNLAPAVNTVLDNIDCSRVKCVLLYSGSGKARPCEKTLSKRFGINAWLHLVQPLDHAEETAAAIDGLVMGA